MSAFYKISAYNSQSLFFWGDEASASQYVDWLNRRRDINVYSAAAVPADEWTSLEGRNDVLSSEDAGWDDFMADDGASS